MALQFKVTKLVTVPLLKVPDNGTPIYATITSEIFVAKDTSGRTAAAPAVPGQESPAKQQPPKLAHIINLETGEVQQIIVGSVLDSELNEAYPNNAYVGKSFEIKKSKPTGNKRYAMYQIAEIEIDAGEAEAAPAKKSK